MVCLKSELQFGTGPYKFYVIYWVNPHRTIPSSQVIFKNLYTSNNFIKCVFGEKDIL